MMPFGETTSSEARTVEAKIVAGPTGGTWTVTFRSEAVPGTLAAFAGTLSSVRLDIISAVMRATADGAVSDSFDVAVLDGACIGPSDADRLAALATAILNGRHDLASDLRELRRKHPPQAGIAPRVDMSMDSSLTTGIHVVAADCPGLLHDIASTISTHGMRTRALAVLTHSGKAHDTFRVVDAAGMPPRQAGPLQALCSDLLRVCAG